MVRHHLIPEIRMENVTWDINYQNEYATWCSSPLLVTYFMKIPRTFHVYDLRYYWCDTYWGRHLTSVLGKICHFPHCPLKYSNCYLKLPFKGLNLPTQGTLTTLRDLPHPATFKRAVGALSTDCRQDHLFLVFRVKKIRRYDARCFADLLIYI